MTEPVIRSIPLDRLEPSPANVRKTAAGKAAFDELKASIAAHGLIENLVARSAEPGEDGGERFAVIAGARRLAAMNQLANEGVLDADHPVPCRIVANGAIDGELSLAENVIRVAMHPADQVEAFGALALAGATVADIAARFGVSERTVEQRLRLGHVAPELLDAYREDKIDLATLKAFTVTTDRTRQLAVWEQVSEQGYRPSDWQIRRMLTEDRIPAGAALARYVGVDAYEAAGGPVLRDLFADEHENGVWLEDPALLMKLALDWLQVAADELATRWKWAEGRLDVDWSDLARFGRVHPTPAEPTDEEKAEIERLHVRHDKLVNLDEDEWTEELVEEAEAIEPRLAEIRDAIKARAVYKPEDIAISGCIVTVGNDGTLQVVHGLVKPEDMPAKDAGDGDADTTAQNQHTGGHHAGSRIAVPSVSDPAMPPARPDPEAEARKEVGVGIGLADDLRAIRTTLVKAHLAEDFGAAFDLMLFQMGRAVFTSGYHDDALDIAVRETPDRPPLRANDGTFHESSPGEVMLEDRSSLRFDWLEIEEPSGILRRSEGTCAQGQEAVVRRQRRAHAERPARLRGERAARDGSDGGAARHRVRRPRPARRRAVLVARAQGPDVGHCPPHPRHRVGAHPPQGQEGHPRHRDGDRFRSGRRGASGRLEGRPRRGARLGAARLCRLRHRPCRRGRRGGGASGSPACGPAVPGRGSFGRGPVRCPAAGPGRTDRPGRRRRSPRGTRERYGRCGTGCAVRAVQRRPCPGRGSRRRYRR